MARGDLESGLRRGREDGRVAPLSLSEGATVCRVCTSSPLPTRAPPPGPDTARGWWQWLLWGECGGSGVPRRRPPQRRVPRAHGSEEPVHNPANLGGPVALPSSAVNRTWMRPLLDRTAAVYRSFKSGGQAHTPKRRRKYSTHTSSSRRGHHAVGGTRVPTSREGCAVLCGHQGYDVTALRAPRP